MDFDYKLINNLLNETPSYTYGEVHTHHISFENSRPSSNILSAWVCIERLGVDGYRRYWAQLMSTGLYLRQVITKHYSREMRVINTSALGYPNVIQLLPPGFTSSYHDLLHDKAARDTYNSYCSEFYEFMAYHLLKRTQSYPLLGFMPSYLSETTKVKRPAFVMYLIIHILLKRTAGDFLKPLSQ